MKYCTQCGTRLEADARFCTGCGTSCQTVAAQPAAAVPPTVQTPLAPKKELTATQKHQQKFSFIRDRIACGWFHVAAVLDNGTCVAHGDNDGKQCDISHWKDIVKIQCGPFRTIGLKKDGTVLCTKGDVHTGGRIPGEGIEQFHDVVDIACGLFHNVGLMRDGTVVACGFNDEGQCDVSGWRNVRQIYAARSHTIALCTDGSLLYCGGEDGGALHLKGMSSVERLYCGENDTLIITEDNKVFRTDFNCEAPVLLDIKGDEVAYAAFAAEYFLILKTDGTVLPFGNVDEEKFDVSDWQGILNIACGPNGASGISRDKMWLSAPGEYHSFDKKFAAVSLVSQKVTAIVSVYGEVLEHGTDVKKQWKLFECVPSISKDIGEKMCHTQVAQQMHYSHKTGIAWEHKQKYGYLTKRMAGGIAHTAAVMYDDRVRICGANGTGQCDGDGWTNMKAVACTGTATIGLRKNGNVVYSGRIPVDGCPAGTPTYHWPATIVDISACIGKDDHVLGLTSDGRVFAFGGNESGQCDVGTWCDIVEIATAHMLSVGVRKDGTVVTCGEDHTIKAKVSQWRNIEHVYTDLSDHNLIGLKHDGTVVTTADYLDVSDWRDIIDISCSLDRVAGLRGDGRVYFAGDFPSNYKRQGKQGVLTVHVFANFVTTFRPDGRMIVDNVSKNGETKTDHYDVSTVVFNHGFSHVIAACSNGEVLVMPLQDTPAPLDETDNWIMFKQQPVNHPPTNNINSTPPTVASPPKDTNAHKTRRKELERERDKNFILGIVFLFLFWPVSIYFFWKYSKVSNEIAKFGV